MTIELKGGFTTEDPRLNRIPEFDETSRSYQVREMLGNPNPIRKLFRRHRFMVLGPTLDQGQEGQCTAYSTGHALSQAPFRSGPFSTELLREMYYQNQRDDAWPGGEYPGGNPKYSGSSVLASMKTLLGRGYIKEYRWIGAGSGRAIDDLIETVRYIGPVCLGVNWYESMYNTDPSGVLHVDTSKLSGGHAVCAVDSLTVKLPGTAKREQYIVLQNSWGPDWGTKFRGQGGFAYVPVSDMEVLLANGGEGAVPLKG